MLSLDAPLRINTEHEKVAFLPRRPMPPPSAREIKIAELRGILANATEAELRLLLDWTADALQSKGALRLLADIARERRLETMRGPQLEHEAAREAAAFPGGVA
jgi:hypothetical protein